MSLDIQQPCSSSSCSSASQLLDMLSAQLAVLSSASSSSVSSASSGSSAHPSSPPPNRLQFQYQNHQRLGGGGMAPNGGGGGTGPKKLQDQQGGPEVRFVQNAIAAAVLARLHRWCCQLFWLTLCMMISYCKQQEAGGGVGAEAGTTGAEQGSRVPHTFHEVRKSIVQATQRRGCKTVTELEMQLLRHLTCPQSAVLRPLRPSQHSKRRHFLSRPPSPQLFDILENEENE